MPWGMLGRRGEPIELCCCRSAYATVWDMIVNGTREDDRRVHVKGAHGCGKSVFLSATAEYLRQNGWCVTRQM